MPLMCNATEAIPLIFSTKLSIQSSRQWSTRNLTEAGKNSNYITDVYVFGSHILDKSHSASLLGKYHLKLVRLFTKIFMTQVKLNCTMVLPAKQQIHRLEVLSRKLFSQILLIRERGTLQIIEALTQSKVFVVDRGFYINKNLRIVPI